MTEPEDIEARVRRDLAESMWRSLEADLYPEIDFSFPPGVHFIEVDLEAEIAAARNYHGPRSPRHR